MSGNKNSSKQIVAGGGKRRTLTCQCGAVVCFHQPREVEPWCRRHSRVCGFMRENFHKVTDMSWVNTTYSRTRHNNAFRQNEWEGRLRTQH